MHISHAYILAGVNETCTDHRAHQRYFRQQKYLVIIFISVTKFSFFRNVRADLGQFELIKLFATCKREKFPAMKFHSAMKTTKLCAFYVRSELECSYKLYDSKPLFVN